MLSLELTKTFFLWLTDSEKAAIYHHQCQPSIFENKDRLKTRKEVSFFYFFILHFKMSTVYCYSPECSLGCHCCLFSSLGISESIFFSRVRLGRTVMLPVLMAVNYADKVSAVKAASQKTWTYCKISEKQVRAYWIQLPHPLGEEQSSVLSWSWR